MGSGKSYWGKKWAERANIPYYDLDQEIERIEGISINTIFEKKGEPYFREKERLVLQSMAALNNGIIACGGGAPCYEDNIEKMNAMGTTVYLSATPDYLLQNILKDPGGRPLINHLNEAELLFFIEKKMAERIAYYSKAQFTILANEANEETLFNIQQQIQ